MAKSKKKPLKQHKVPREKFLVVVDAWGLMGDFMQSDFNQISAWFEIMLEDAYPKTRVSSIYYQRTHRNIIVELPREVEDVNQYLGAHFYSQFLTHETPGHRQVLIYEYNYATFGDPGEKNWSVGYPNYTSIPPDIPIKRPFPLLPFPSPLPTSDIPYARPVPVDVLAANQMRHVQALKAAEPTIPCSSSKSDPGTSFSSSQLCNDQPTSSPSVPLLPRTTESPQPSSSRISNHPEGPHAGDKGKSRMVEVPPPPTGAFTPYVAPSHLTAHLKESIPLKLPSAVLGDQVTKRDPYEEEEESRNVLWSPVTKTEEAEDFLSSFLPAVKEEEEKYIKPEDDEDYQPSAELLAALNTLPPELLDGGMEVGEGELKPQVKPEPIEPEIGDYHPSDELLAALAELPSGLRPEQVVVKSEADEHQPSDELLAALSSLPPEKFHASTQDVPVKRERDVFDGFGESKFTPRVKQEPMEGVLPRTLHRPGQSSAAQPSNSKHLSAPQSHIQVKSEPMDDGYRLKHLPPPNRFLPRQVDYDASRDPRLKRPDLQSKSSGDKRDGGHLSHLHANTLKRIKREYLED